MTTPVYPTNLPMPSGFSSVPTPQEVASENTEGPRQVRRRTRVPASTVDVSWSFFGSDYSDFVAWYRDTLLFGTKWFQISLPSAAGVVTHVVKFADKGYSANRAGYRYWTVTASLEIRERQFQ